MSTLSYWLTALALALGVGAVLYLLARRAEVQDLKEGLDETREAYRENRPPEYQDQILKAQVSTTEIPFEPFPLVRPVEAIAPVEVAKPKRKPRKKAVRKPKAPRGE